VTHRLHVGLAAGNEKPADVDVEDFRGYLTVVSAADGLLAGECIALAQSFDVCFDDVDA